MSKSNADGGAPSTRGVLAEPEWAINRTPAFRRELGALWRRRGIAAGIALVGTAAVVAWARMTPPTYMATTLLLVEPRERQVVGETAISGLSSDLVDIETVEKLLRSDATLHRAAVALGGSDVARIARGEAVPGASLAGDKDQLATPLRHNLAVAQQGRSQVIAVSFTSTDPRTAVAVADTVARVFVEGQLGWKQQAVGEILDQLEPRLRELGADAGRAEAAVRQFRDSHGLSSDPAGDLSRSEAARLRAALVDANVDLAAMLAEGRDGAEPIGEGAGASAEMPSGNPDVASARARVAALGDAIAVAERRASEIEAARVELAPLVHEADAAGAIFDAVLTRAREMREQQALMIADVSIVSPAALPTRPASPGAGLMAVLGLASFGFLGVITALAVDQLAGGPQRSQVGSRRPANLPGTCDRDAATVSSFHCGTTCSGSV